MLYTFESDMFSELYRKWNGGGIVITCFENASFGLVTRLTNLRLYKGYYF